MRKLLMTTALALCVSAPSLSFAQAMNKSSAITQALSNSPAYHAALANVDIYGGEKRQAALLPNPNVAFEVENFAGGDNYDGFENAEITFGVEQSFELGQKRQKRGHIADLSQKIAKEEALAQALHVASETEYAFIRMAVAQKRIILAQKQYDLAEKTHDMVQERVGAARSAEIEHSKADIERASAKIERRQAEQEHRVAKTKLAQLLGLDLDSTVKIDADLNAIPALIDYAQLMASLKDVPNARIQEFSKMQARSAFALEKATLTPDPTIGFGVRRFNDADDTALIASISVPIPVFDRNQGNIEKARAAIARADSLARAEQRNLQQSALATWEALSVAIEEAHNYKNEIIPNAEKAYQQADEGYSRGAFSFLELLDAQRTLNEVQSAYLDSTLRLYQAKTQIDFLTAKHAELAQETAQNILQGQNND